MKIVRIVLALVVTALIAQTVVAQEKAAPKRGGRGPGGQMDIFRLPRGIELTDEQKTKIEALKKGDLGKKVEDVRKELAGILT